MPNYEYKSISLPGKFKSANDIVEMDRVINESAINGWELITSTPVANSAWDYGKTSAVILTFRREKT